MKATITIEVDVVNDWDDQYVRRVFVAESLPKAIMRGALKELGALGSSNNIGIQSVSMKPIRLEVDTED